MIVADASAIVDVLINARTAPILRSRLFDDGDTVHAPQLLDVEVLHVIRKRFLVREMTAGEGETAIAQFRLMPIERYSHEILLDRIWQLRENLTAYDAAYVALAEVLDTVVLTTDAKLAAAPGLSRRIRLVS